MTRGSFFDADSPPAFSEPDPLVMSVKSLSDPEVDFFVRSTFFAAPFLPGEVAGLAFALAVLAALCGFRSRRVRLDGGMGARGGTGTVCDESIDAKSSTVLASHGSGGAVWDGRPPLRFLVAASSCIPSQSEHWAHMGRDIPQ